MGDLNRGKPQHEAEHLLFVLKVNVFGLWEAMSVRLTFSHKSLVSSSLLCFEM